MNRQTVGLLAVVALLMFMPLILQANVNFSGADDLAKSAISEVTPGYQPWFTPIWEPPSAEVYNFLFALQAALGGLFVGYFLGYYEGPKARKTATTVDR